MWQTPHFKALAPQLSSLNAVARVIAIGDLYPKSGEREKRKAIYQPYTYTRLLWDDALVPFAPPN